MKEAPLVQQVDVATAPEKKSKPKRALIVLAMTAAGLMAGILKALSANALQRLSQSPEFARKWLSVKQAWTLRRSPSDPLS